MRNDYTVFVPLFAVCSAAATFCAVSGAAVGGTLWGSLCGGLVVYHWYRVRAPARPAPPTHCPICTNPTTGPGCDACGYDSSGPDGGGDR